ncbi:peptidase S41 [Caulobacter sp. 17J65-9]|uniref:peptidase S41 n=1 Tax=Caulobacter sp. 17J65-9 TaxID=2709382 RepID=UPI0013C8C6BE|nr:peptidase S41 [Caulobacter sp. 17J65-9]NEX95081.1 peptidase S41 [Caulobacter sp. 17J65-9]
MIRTGVIAVAAAAVLASTAQAAEPGGNADWGAALRQDAEAFHDLILDSHPGPVDPENPGFKPLLERGLKAALVRAKTAKTYPDYYFALQTYAASFDDGHLGLTNYRTDGFVFTSRWPGFLTALRGDRNEVVFREDEAAPPMGAVLVSCDGRAADALAAEVVGRTAGRWSLRSRREAYSAALFVDYGNPYVRRAQRCVFEANGARKTYALAWRDLPAATRDKGFAVASAPRFTTPIELRPYGDGGFWVGLGSFDGDPTSADGVKLTALSKAVEARAGDLRAAPVVVFDLRGNNGGSSSWLSGMAKSLWGAEYVAAREPQSEGVDWRVSDGNIAHMGFLKEMFGKAETPDPELMAWLDGAVAGLKAAKAEGRPYWRKADEEGAPEPAVVADTPMKAKAYVFTDFNCASACLDAVDLLTALGAIHVGQETSADTAYMEVREQRLPGDRVTAYVPVKVYRGRPRGSNVPAAPAVRYTGDLRDTAAVEAFVGGLR